MKTKTKTGALPNSAGFTGTNMISKTLTREDLRKQKSVKEEVKAVEEKSHYIYWG